MEEKKFDANSIIGFLLLGAIMLWFMYTNQPEEQVPANTNAEQASTQNGENISNQNLLLSQPNVSDSIVNIETQKRLGNFAYSSTLNVASKGTTVIENELIKLTIANKGGQIIEALVKNYKSYDSLPLYIIKDANAAFNINFASTSNRIFNTEDLIFQPNLSKIGENTILSMKLKVSESNYLEYRYELKPNDYMIGFAVRSIGLSSILLMLQIIQI